LGKTLWTMDDDKEFKKELIDYIKAKDKDYAKESLENCSITALTIIKTGIEIRLHNSKKKK